MSQACVILAAGRGSRMGGRNKALLGGEQESFLSRIAERCRLQGVVEMVVVVALPHQEATVAEAKRLGLSWVSNDEPGRGMASSVAVGFARAMQSFQAEHCWLWPVDSPGIASATLQRLYRRASEAAIVIPCYRGRGGHPSLVERSVWHELATCADAAEGARTVFRRDQSRVLRVEVEDAAVVVDVDVPEDLEKLA